MSALGLVTILAIGLAGCAGSSSQEADPSAVTRLPIDRTATPEPGGSTQSGGVVVWVGTAAITKSALESRMAMEVRGEPPGQDIVPVPPAFAVCAARLDTVARSTPGNPPTTAQLKSQCRQRYQALLQKVLKTLISDEWVIGGAAEEGLEVPDEQVRQRLEHLKAVQFGSEAKFQKFLSQTGENIQDLLFNAKAELASDRIHQRINASAGTVTPPRYYAEHKRQFEVAEQRDLGIVRTKSAATAKRVKTELQSGTSFASVAKRLAREQPVYTANSKGLLMSLEPHVFQEPTLNDAIFSAKPHVVSGPVRINLSPGRHFRSLRDIQNIDGYYIFEVKAVRRAHERSFGQVKAAITQQLPSILEKHALVSYVKAWRRRWLLKTDCRPGYLVRKCRQVRATKGEAAEDAYTLN